MTDGYVNASIMEKLTHALLRRLMDAGYNILEGDREITDDNVIYRPLKVDDIDAYLRTRDEDYMREHVIEDALNNWPEEDLHGSVEVPGGA